MSEIFCPSCKVNVTPRHSNVLISSRSHEDVIDDLSDSADHDNIHKECPTCGHCWICDQPESELYELYKDKMIKLWSDYERVCDEVVARFKNINDEKVNETVETFQWMIDNFYFKLPSVSDEEQSKHARLVDPFMFANKIQLEKDDKAFCAFIEIDEMLLNVDGCPKFLCNVNEKATLVDYDNYSGFKQSADESE